MPEQHPSIRNASVRKLLLQLGAAMVAGGQPIFEVEEELRRVAWTMGYDACQVSATPTSVMVSLHPGEAASLLAVRNPLSLDQSTIVNDIRRRLMAHKVGVGQALAELTSLRAHPARWGDRAVAAGNMCVSAGICLLLQPALPNVLLAAGMGLVVALLMRAARSVRLVGTLLPTFAAFSVTVLALLATQAGIIDGPLRTLICSIAVLLPGATLATGLAELAAGMMISGTSRVTYGATQLLLFTVGVLGAALVLRQPMSVLANTRIAAGSPWLAPASLLLITTGIFLMESLPVRLLPWVMALLTCTFLAQAGGQAWLGQAPLGSFTGATVAAFGASAIEASRPNIPRLVVFLPSFWLLVPGTLGLIGITEVGSHSASSVLVIMTAVNQIVGIALGLLIGSALGRPIHAAARRRRRRNLALNPDVVPAIGPEGADTEVMPAMPRPGVD